MKKGNCERCGEYRYVNLHHVYPKKFFGSKDNYKTVMLCLDCHAELHEVLPKEAQTKEFYKSFTAKFIGILILLFALISAIL